jgi:hypothetical protein
MQPLQRPHRGNSRTSFPSCVISTRPRVASADSLTTCSSLSSPGEGGNRRRAAIERDQPQLDEKLYLEGGLSVDLVYTGRHLMPAPVGESVNSGLTLTARDPSDGLGALEFDFQPRLHGRNVSESCYRVLNARRHRNRHRVFAPNIP